MPARVAGCVLLVAAMPLGAVAATLALVAAAAVAGHRLPAAVAGTLALVACTGGLSWLATGGISPVRRRRYGLAVGVTGVTLAVMAAAVGVLVYAPAPPSTPFPATGAIRYWELPTGSRLAYTHTRARAQRRPTPVILVHGGPGAPDAQSPPLAATLAEAGFDVYAYHQLGAGLSARLTDPSGYTLARHLADLDAIRATIGAEQIVLLGSSWGGQLIANYLAAHPDRVARAVLSSPGVIWAPAFTDAQRLTHAGRQDQDAVIAGHPRFLVAHALLHAVGPRTAQVLLPDRQLDADFEAVVAGIDLRSGCASRPDTPAPGSGQRPAGLGFWANAATVRDTQRVADPRPRLRRVTVPVLVLRGRCDYLAWEVTREYRDLLPNAVLLPIDQAGHRIPADQPARYRRAVRAFLLDQPLPGQPHTADAAPRW
jgi:proline iminopeptidase